MSSMFAGFVPMSWRRSFKVRSMVTRRTRQAEMEVLITLDRRARERFQLTRLTGRVDDVQEFLDENSIVLRCRSRR